MFGSSGLVSVSGVTGVMVKELDPSWGVWLDRCSLMGSIIEISVMF
jgi:hypothetical protein